MGRVSSWKNKPLSSLPVPVAFKPFLREAGRAIDAAEAVSFEREVTDCDGTILSLSIAVSVVSPLQQVEVVAVEPVEVESVEETSLDVDDTQKLEAQEPLAITAAEPEEIILEEEDLPDLVVQSEPDQYIEPKLPVNTPEQLETLEPVSDHESDNTAIDLLEVISIESDDSRSESSETVDSEGIADLETPVELPITVTIPTVIPNEGLEINAIAQTHPVPPDPYVDLQVPATTLTKTPFVDQLYQAWVIEGGGASASNPQPILLEQIYQNHFSSILGVTFLRKVEQSINLPGSGLKIHINLGASETYKLKNGLTLEGISFSHTPEQKGNESNANGSTAQAQVLATIALSVIGTCVVASSVLALMPGMKGFQHISPAIPSRYK